MADAVSTLEGMSTPHLQLFSKAVELHQDHDLNGAKAIYRRLLAVYPKDPTLLYLLGRIYFDQGVWSESLRFMDKALTANPHYDYALFFKGMIKLTFGEFEEGWKLYEWRWKSIRKERARAFPQPLWLGKEPLKGKTILIYPEQGMGDNIQMCRYVPRLEALGATVIIETPASLSGLLSTLKGNFYMVPEGQSLPPFDFHCPFFSLPLAFNTQLETIPADIPYLYADLRKQALWQERLGPKTQPRIGLVWSGAIRHENDHNRSIELKKLLPLLDSGAEFHSLQKEVRSADADALAQSKIISHINDLADFSDTAALIAEMDLVLSVDTSIAHIAGAMGKPVWIWVPYVPDFRWMLEREDSPWYPTARLFRQPRVKDWDSVVGKVAAELKTAFEGGLTPGSLSLRSARR